MFVGEQTNPSWIYANEHHLSGSLDCSMVEEMVSVVPVPRTERKRSSVIKTVIASFMAYASEVSVMPDSTVFDLHSQLAGASARSDRRRFSVFELFHIRFGDSVFPGIIRWHQGLQSYAPDTCELNDLFCDLELDFSSFVKKKGIQLPRITNTMLKAINDLLHFTRCLCWCKISRDDYIDFLVDSLQKRWDDGITTPGYLIADMLNHYIASVDLQSQTALFDLLEVEYGVQLCCILLPPMHVHSRRERHQNMMAEQHNMETDNLAAHFHNIKESWPLPVPQDVKNRCI
ncbi:uncharacterized protein EV420DRAFT_1650053 [Desarmillaria tabescens]|uniref:Uncharacterized protein n=1 Tax=Armillaria tabescens TaxID=1929756 RepID=A0AA39MP49_ARMTA|nr:uncharacterized protein EV420DRAFT_1650053 [Desarmillaria tabescens]KAK0441452.1 hypothetical protein EV420DRAFT_1650053 [Desarmillaria tabescens]